MNNEPKLPAHRSGAGSVIDVCLAISADIASLFGVPTNTVVEGIRKLLQQRLEQAQEILIAEIKRGNWEAVSEEGLKEFIPIANRFFRAAQEGEHVHNLRILAQLIRGSNGFTTPPDEFLSFSDALSGLSKAELILCHEVSRGPVMFKGLTTTGNFEAYRRKLVPNVFETPTQLRAALSKLCGRGLAFQQLTTPPSDFNYFPSRLLERLVASAKIRDDTNGGG